MITKYPQTLASACPLDVEDDDHFTGSQGLSKSATISKSATAVRRKKTAIKWFNAINNEVDRKIHPMLDRMENFLSNAKRSVTNGAIGAEI